MKKFLQSIFLSLIVLLVINSYGYGQMSILLVNDNGYSPSRITVIQDAISNNGYTYTDYNTVNEGASPSYSYMSNFDLVIWYTGNDGAGLYFWNGNETDNQDIKDYIDNGGMFWLMGLDFLYDRYGGAPDTFVAGDFVYDYLGIKEYIGQSHLDDGVYSDGVPQLDVVPGNPIFTFTPMEWVWSTMWYADALYPTASADSIYRMGPAGYDFDTCYNSVYLEKGDGKVLTIATETAKIDTQDNTDTYFGEGLVYFEQFVDSTILITDITVYGEGNATTIDVDYGTLQMYANILPTDATNTTLLWSVIDGTATATIDTAGLLQATGTPGGNGTVWVKAEALDGSGVADSVEITISNQGTSTDYHILLVNDNGNGSDRYLVLKTSLEDLGYNFDVYNTVSKDTFPDFTTLDMYGVVIWYTGNDGVALKLWDITDTNDYKFNDPLVQYVDAGGIVWLQGLDYMYDIVGGAPDSFTEGQFIYDYMGIEEYHGQSKVDDGGTGLPQMDTIYYNGIFNLDTVKWTYSTLWYADALQPTPDARSVYNMGPDSYIFSDYSCGMYKYTDAGGLIMNFAVETARIDTQDNTDTIFDQGLAFFEYFLSNDILTEEIDVFGDDEFPLISEDGGTTQLYANVYPLTVPSYDVEWSVVPVTAIATIDSTGLLHASGTPAGNGTVWAKATATDGTGIADSILVSIENQGTSTESLILLVNDNDNDSDRYLVLKTSLDNLGYSYDIFNTETEGTYPDFDALSQYTSVIWYTGNDGVDLYLWDVSDSTNFKFNEPLIQYIDSAGIVWLQGLDYLYDIVGGAPDSFTEGQFIYDYLGIEEYYGQSHVDDDGTGLPQMDAQENNGIFTLSPVFWTYTEMWYADALSPTQSARSVYNMGPESYELSGYSCGLYNYIDGGGLVMNFAVETARLDTQDNTDTLINQGLSFFEYYINNTILVDSIIVYGEGGIDYIDQDGGTLQMYADVFPMFAPENEVTWSVIDGTATATIDENGLLQATGTSEGNGNVYVKATSVADTEISDSLLITISNQGAPPDFNILLVNDNANGTDRYLVLDTTLFNLGYAYDIYNTVETDTFPDLTTLGDYNLVIWYTGNDGVDLHLWDISDTNNYKFNEPLREYINNGGYVWLQGLDFLYDIYGGAPDIFEPGTYIYDVMGIQEYHAQSKADDGGLGLPQMDVVPGNGVCSLTPIQWVYSTLWYADAIAVTEGTNPIYSMGPEDYVFSDYYTGFEKWTGSGCVMTFTVETARIDTRENTEELFYQVIEYFKLITGIDNPEMEKVTDFIVFPNPATSYITIRSLNKELKNGLFEIYDINGKKVLSQPICFNKEIKVSLNGLQKGFYIYNVISDSGSTSGKIIKQ